MTGRSRFLFQQSLFTELQAHAMEEEGARHGGGPELSAAGGADLISALPEDLLLLVLVRLRCAAAAARTSLLSRRWRGLWTRLPDLTFRDLAPVPLLRALASLQSSAVVGPGVSLLDICVPAAAFDKFVLEGRVSSLLDAAAGLSPVELRLAVPPMIIKVQVKVPHFHRVTSIELHGLDLAFADSPSLFLCAASTDPQKDIFPALERLSLSACNVDLPDLVLRCPRLRVLRETGDPQYTVINIRSASLQELDMENETPFMEHIHIDTPALKQLGLSLGTGCGVTVDVSILAPLLEKVSWRCCYYTVVVGLPRWGLFKVALKPAESSVEDAHLQQLPSVHVLSLYWFYHISLCFPEEAAELTTEIEKHMIIHFSVLELHFKTRGHAFGASALQILGMRRIRTATRSLKIVLVRSEDKEACPVNCPCDERKNWRSQSISLTNLETVEIKGFEGDDHECDFIRLIFRCAPMLKRMTVRLSDAVTTSNDWCTRIYDIFKAYPIVECDIIDP
uniref:Uncharacterized protein n=1 Tax=Avena sativa TaxID=4498 RepID=A0ACD5WFE2_AVESA